MKVELLNVFVASPGDVAEERKTVREVVEELNRGVAYEKNAMLRVVEWETDARPGFGGDPQHLVNEQIAEMSTYDLFIGILWDRFGTPTPRAGSGTEEEFNRAVVENRKGGRPEIMFYFCQRPTVFKTPEQTSQKSKVLEFRSKIQPQGLIWEYQGVEDFRRHLTTHLSLWLRKLGSETPPPPPERTTKTEAEETVGTTRGETAKRTTVARRVSDSGAWVLLNNAFYKTKEASEKNDGTVELQIAPVNAEEDSALRSLRQDGFRRPEAISYAFQNDGYIARVLSAELRSVGGKSLWVISLRADKDVRSNSGLEMSFNGISADEIATRRARLILLDEPVSLPGIGGDRMLESMISGLSSDLRVTEGAFPKLWATFRDRPQVFLPAARLWAVFLLKTSGTCEQILDMTLGPLAGTILPVEFRGRRHQKYSNVDPALVEVQGNCKLDH